MKKLGYILITLSATVLFTLFVYIIIVSDKKVASVLDSYDRISPNDSTFFKITDIKKHRGTPLITTQNGRKVLFESFYVNDDYEKKYFDDFVMKYDSIAKRNLCDTIYLIRDGKRYFFTKIILNSNPDTY